MKVTLELNIYELARTIQTGTLESLVNDVQKSCKQEVDTAVSTLRQEEKAPNKTAVKNLEEENKAVEKETKTPNTAIEEPPEITIEEVRAAFVAKNSKSNSAKLKAILNKFGVTKVTALKEKDFPAVLEALEEI